MIPIQDAVDAIKRGDEQSLGALLDQHPHISGACDENGVSLLMLACYHRQTNIAETLANSRELDVFESAALGRIDRLAALCEAQPDAVHAISADGFSPLHLAAFFGRAGVARALLDLGADVNAIAENPSRVRPIHSAVADRNNETIELLVAHGALLDVQQHGGWTPLHAAALHGDQKLVDLFLRHGANSRLLSDDGKDAATLAADKNHTEIAARLAEASTRT